MASEPNRFRSKLFRERPIGGKQLVEDLASVVSADLPVEHLPDIVRLLADWVLASTRREEATPLEALRTRFRVPPKQVTALVGLGPYFLRNTPAADSATAILQDMLVAGLVTDEEHNRIAPLISALVDHAPEFQQKQRVLSYQQAALPTLTGVDHTVDFRAVIKAPFSVDDDVEKYTPDIEGVVPLAIVRIRLSDDQDAVFQLDERTIEVLASSLIAIRKELAAAKRSMSSLTILQGRSPAS